MILNTDFNHVTNGKIEPFKKGQDVSHLPKPVIAKLKEAGHIEGYASKSSGDATASGDEELKAKVADLESQLSDTTAKLEKAEEAVADLTITIEEGKVQVTGLFDQVSELQAQVESLNAENADLKEKLTKKVK